MYVCNVLYVYCAQTYYPDWTTCLILVVFDIGWMQFHACAPWPNDPWPWPTGLAHLASVRCNQPMNSASSHPSCLIFKQSCKCWCCSGISDFKLPSLGSYVRIWVSKHAVKWPWNYGIFLVVAGMDKPDGTQTVHLVQQSRCKSMFLSFSPVVRCNFRCLGKDSQFFTTFVGWNPRISNSQGCPRYLFCILCTCKDSLGLNVRTKTLRIHSASYWCSVRRFFCASVSFARSSCSLLISACTSSMLLAISWSFVCRWFPKNYIIWSVSLKVLFILLHLLFARFSCLFSTSDLLVLSSEVRNTVQGQWAKACSHKPQSSRKGSSREIDKFESKQMQNWKTYVKGETENAKHVTLWLRTRIQSVECLLLFTLLCCSFFRFKLLVQSSLIWQLTIQKWQSSEFSMRISDILRFQPVAPWTFSLRQLPGPEKGERRHQFLTSSDLSPVSFQSFQVLELRFLFHPCLSPYTTTSRFHIFKGQRVSIEKDTQKSRKASLEFELRTSASSSSAYLASAWQWYQWNCHSYAPCCWLILHGWIDCVDCVDCTLGNQSGPSPQPVAPLLLVVAEIAQRALAFAALHHWRSSDATDRW